MRVAVTGGNGFLVGYLIEELYRCGHEVVLLSRSEGMRNDLHFEITDYSEDSLSEILAGNVDAVAHLASSRKVADNFSFYVDLIDMTQNLYRAAEKNGIRNIVYTSSISVYSGDKLPYTETNLPAPINTYGLYKLSCEMIGEMAVRQCGLKIKNLRLAHLYGANEKNDYMINRFLRQAHAHEQMIVHCRSYAKREMLYTKDAATAIRLALEHKNAVGSFNIGSSEALTNEEIATTICTALSPERSVKIGNAKETIVSSYMNSAKAKEQLEFCARYSFRSAVEDIAREMK